MSFSLRAATAAAFSLTVLAAIMASDTSRAWSADASVDTIPAAIRAPQDSPSAPDTAKDGNTASAVKFAAPHEVAQSLVHGASNVPVADTAHAVPDGILPAASLSEMVAARGTPEALDDQTQCLAGAVYFESKGESLAGQLAVARVIVNRMQSGRFASSLCGVVYQPGQFSFVRGHAMPAIATAGHAWREAVAISQIALTDSWNSLAEGALYFHARRVAPNWKQRARVALIDNHIFYR
jgi:spore germination cell wall hydrolase CwlJ-like protein